MKKYLFLSLACLMALCAMAQTIDAIKVTQGETTDWYPFGKSSRIDVAITDGNTVFPGGKTYNLANGNVETAFDTDPLPAIKEAAIADINNVATCNKNSILEYAVADQVKETARNEIDKAVAAAEASITNADSEEQVNDAKNDALNKINQQLAYVQDYYNKLQAAIAEINDVANAAKEEIDGLGVDESAKSDAKADIGNIANTAKAGINAATSKDEIDNAKTEAIAKIHDVVQTTKNMWVIVRTGVTANDWNTICMERTITDVDGATFWNVIAERTNEFELEQVTEPQAGYGYIIRYTATELKVKYGDQVVDAPVEAKDNDLPIQGRFAEITCDEDGQNELVGNYVVYQNQLCKVTGWVTMADHRAYVIAGKAPKQAPAPNGAPRLTMPKPNGTPTELKVQEKGLRNEEKGLRKVIENGQFRIVRDNKMYNAQGIEL